MESNQVIKTWSYSRLQTYDACPFKAKMLYIEGFKEPSNKYMDRGSAIHDELDAWLKGKDDRVPQCAIKLEEECLALKAQRPYTELSVGLNNEWKSVEWMAKDVWARVKIDVLTKELAKVSIIDWKTGQIRDGYGEQLELYAVTGLCMFPKVDEVTTANYYLDAGEIKVGTTFTRDDLPVLKERWVARVMPMLTDTAFHPKRNAYCYNCQFRKSNGGACPENM